MKEKYRSRRELDKKLNRASLAILVVTMGLLVLLLVVQCGAVA